MIKVKQVNKQFKNKNITSLFNQMLGVNGEVNYDVILPKYNTIKNKVTMYKKILKASTEDTFIKFDQKKECKDNIDVEMGSFIGKIYFESVQ